jgi:hypothetical protein
VKTKYHYVHGAHNVICDRSGFKVKSTDIKKEWNGNVVRSEDYEARHPQDFVRGVPDNQSVLDPRPGSERFYSTDPVLTSDAISGDTEIFLDTVAV